MADGRSVRSRPRLLDLFCGAGGAATGYHRAGFEVIGIDINPQPNYPFEFILMDALSALTFEALMADIDAIHASPPCQRYSAMSTCRPGLAGEYPDLILPTRIALRVLGLPWVIENVPGAPLLDPTILCGTMFGRELYRHRLFESSFPLAAPSHPEHVLPASKAGHWTPGTVMSVAGHMAPIAKARGIMGIDWMNRAELGEAIPPCYAEHVGGYFMAELDARQEAAA